MIVNIVKLLIKLARETAAEPSVLALNYHFVEAFIAFRSHFNVDAIHRPFSLLVIAAYSPGLSRL
jgi:hypothetical protein